MIDSTKNFSHPETGASTNVQQGWIEVEIGAIFTSHLTE